MDLNIVISSGKGGTGKTFLSTNLAATLSKKFENVNYFDCDVEEPNGHLFLKPDNTVQKDVVVHSPARVDPDKCTLCGKCQKACQYNAIAVIIDQVLFFRNLCRVCNACKIVCPHDAIIDEQRKIGEIRHGKSNNIDLHYGLVETGEARMSVRMIKEVKENISTGINIIDSPPGTACPVVETVKDADLCILVTDPTPFGINDLKLAVEMCRELGKEPVVLVNRAEYQNNELQNYLQEARLELIGEVPDDRKIAEIYSVGDILVNTIDDYNSLFETIADRIIDRARKKVDVKIKPKRNEFESGKIEKRIAVSTGKNEFLEYVVISGKGGTGKTSLTAAFTALAQNCIVSDCDVDAADLFLVLNPKIQERGYFSGGQVSRINQEKCVQCGKCFDACQFHAINRSTESGKNRYEVDPIACEGCKVCELVCGEDAIEFDEPINGEWYISETRFGPMTHAKLGVAEENTGKLVSLIRDKRNIIAQENKSQISIIDGSPGTGCPVIASITGCNYAIIVTEPTVSGVHDMKRILDLVKHFSIRSGVIVNKADLNQQMTEKIKLISKEYQSDYLGEIGYDKAFLEAQIEKKSVVEYTDNPTTKNIRQIWERIMDVQLT